MSVRDWFDQQLAMELPPPPGAGRPYEKAVKAFDVKDSGKRETVGSGGMVRDTEDGKVDFTLVLDGPMFERWGAHLTKGAKKYAARNWMKCVHPDATRGELEASAERYRRSLARHWVQYMRGDTDEDHAAAVFFNINGLEYVRQALSVFA
jgi:hypothetical protein